VCSEELYYLCEFCASLFKEVTLLSEIGFEVFAVVLLTFQVFWGVMLCERDQSAFRMPGTTHPMTDNYISEDLNPH
jgi:hypothetical protein